MKDVLTVLGKLIVLGEKTNHYETMSSAMNEMLSRYRGQKSRYI